MDAYTGEIKIWPSPRIPEGWHLCDGSQMPISGYDVLFSVIGTTYGGDGRTTFALPNLQNTAPIHQGTGPTTNNGGPGTARAVGRSGGSATVTLTTAQMPMHDHHVFASNGNANSAKPTPTAMLGTGTGNVTIYAVEAAAGTDFVFDAGSLTAAGGSQAHNNVMPSITLNYIICLNGIYPERP